jgi:UDP-glucose 4-epimerase
VKILVTGGAGFIGSHVVDTYVALGHEVTVVDDLSSGRKKNVNPKAELVTMDIRDPNISTLFAKGRFDLVNHLAAQIDVRRSVQDPFLDASINILGTLRILEGCRTYGVRKLIFASSGGVMYGECRTRAALESDPCQPVSPYGFSKAAAETYIRFFGETYHLPFTILRYGNVYGLRQDPHGEAGVVSIFIGKLLANEPVTIYGTGKQERDYVYVGDVAQANVQALLKGENQILNIGTGHATSVNVLYSKLQEVHGKSPAPAYAPPRPGELDRSVLDSTRAQEVLSWRPLYSLPQGLAETYAFFHQQMKKAPAKKS